MYELDTGALVAGAKLRGEIEGRLKSVIDVLRAMAAEGAAIIVVLHDHDQMTRLADRVLRLERGHGIWSTPATIGDSSSSAETLA